MLTVWYSNLNKCPLCTMAAKWNRLAIEQVHFTNLKRLNAGSNDMFRQRKTFCTTSANHETNSRHPMELKQVKKYVNPPPTLSEQKQAPKSKISSVTTERTVSIPYDINWVFRHLEKPSILWYIASQLIILIVGLASKFVLVFMSRTHVYNDDRLINALRSRPHGTPLLTISNHYSCFDDPGLWGFLPINHVCNTFRIRWSMAAHDICFTNVYHSLFFMLGKCIPVIRGTGVYQEAIDLCIKKLKLGHWVHVFPEGKVNLTKEDLRLKWGVGRMIYESSHLPIIVLPIWHLGMDDVLPNVEPYILQWRKKITLNIGQPIDMNEFVGKLKIRGVKEPEARKLITDKIQNTLRELRLETEGLHNKRK